MTAVRRIATMAASRMKSWFPTTSSPLVVSAPMAFVTTTQLAAEVTKAGGLGKTDKNFSSPILYMSPRPRPATADQFQVLSRAAVISLPAAHPSRPSTKSSLARGNFLGSAGTRAACCLLVSGLSPIRRRLPNSPKLPRRYCRLIVRQLCGYLRRPHRRRTLWQM